MSSQHLVNPDSIAMAVMAVAGLQNTKQAFVPAGDPAMDPSAAAGGGGAPGGDPSGGAGGPPPGGDPSGGGGAPPSAAPPPPDAAAIAQQVMQMIQAQGGMGGGGGGGGGMEPIKPKIDVNVTLLQLLKMMSRIADSLGVQIPASEMVATQNDLTNFGMQQQSGAPGGAGGAGAGGAGAGSSIAPISPIQGASPQAAMGGGGKTAGYEADGTAFDTSHLESLGNKAAAIINFRKAAADRNRKPAA